MKKSIDGFRLEAAAGNIDPAQLKSADVGLTNHIHRLVHWQLAHGLISRDTAASALEAIAEHQLAHLADDPLAYRAARDSGYFDALRYTAGGWDRPESAEAGEKRRAKALQTVAALGADVEMRQQHALAQTDEQRAEINKAYYSFMKHIESPGEIEGLRRQFGDTNTVPGDDDNNLAEPSDTIKSALGAVIHHARTIDPSVLKVDKPQRASEPEPIASDWSESKLEKYFESRSRDEAASEVTRPPK